MSDLDELLEKLRGGGFLHRQAADEIASLRAQLASARKAAIDECIAILNGHEWCKYADGTVSPMGAAAR